MTAPGRIVTFYSYKGGTGRSMALANFAWLMAASGKHVLVIDWDLEAPGLHRYFRPFMVDPDLLETDGLIDALWTIAGAALERSATADTPASTMPAQSAVDGLQDATRRLQGKFQGDGYIDFIGAGRQGATYSERVNTFDWRRFYDLGGSAALDAIKAHVRQQYHWILIDSRTGVSDTSGICTIQMPDTVVALFTMNRQSIEGVASILKSIRSYSHDGLDGSSIRFFPVATRIENAEQRKLELARSFARATFAEFLPVARSEGHREYWDNTEIAYRPSYAFEETLVAFGDATGASGSADTMLAQVERMAQTITGDRDLRMPEVVEEDRQEVLALYALGTSAASAAASVSAEAADTEFLRGVRAKEQLWRTSGFRRHLLLSRRELDLMTEEDRAGFGRQMAFYHLQSERLQGLFRKTELTGVASILLTVLVGVAVYLWKVSSKAADYDIPMLWGATMSAYSLPILWLIFATIFTTDAPHGISFAQVLRLVALGPFHRAVPDYEVVRDHPAPKSLAR